MEQYFDRLRTTNGKNNMLTFEEARIWVELLGVIFETTYAKAGHKYKGQGTTERIVQEWRELQCSVALISK
ncbi:YfhJ family protein [Bacillus stratosphericus]|uniref:YfhJ family protein n=1 Tax=Bacillus TaxID=1386 RepID=UPI0035E455ED